MKVGVERNPITIIILSLVTCGIYAFFWAYAATKEINEALGEDHINFVLYFLVGILCFPLIFVGMYKIDQGIMELQTRAGLPPKSNFVLWIILSFFGVGFYVMMYQAQESLNQLWINSATQV